MVDLGNWLDQNFGEVIEGHDLQLKSARKIVRLALSPEYAGASLAEIRKSPDGREAVVLEVEVSLGQVPPVNDIKRRERIAIICKGDLLPGPISLRPDFPDLPHLNAVDKHTPRTFCLYDEPAVETKRSWTALGFIERVRWWFEKNAYGELHGEGQPLDPILFGGIGFTLIVPDRLLEEEFDGEVIVERFERGGDELGVLRLRAAADAHDQNGALSGAVVLRSQPRPHGRLRFAPANLEELQEFDEEFGVNLIDVLKQKLPQWVADKPDLLHQPLLILLVTPLEREPGAGAEVVSKRAFWISSAAGEVGRALGLVEIDPETGRWASLIGEAPQGSLNQIPLEMGDVRSGFSRNAAADASGQTPDTTKFIQIGAGALGSQLAMTLAQEGFGRWTLVDDDRLMPHNLARHALPFFCVGRYKASALSFQLCRLLDDPAFARPIVCDVLFPEDQQEKLDSAFEEADVVLDTSASVAVSRFLAIDAPRKGPVVSLFFNPAGTDLVLLWEGAEQSVRLDDCEIAYYSALITEKALAGHLALPATGVVHGTACREPSMQMPQSRVARLVGMAAEQLRRIVKQAEPEISVWRNESSDLVKKHSSSPATDCRIAKLHGWEIRCQADVLEALQVEQKGAGKFETGGVLVGAWDRDRKIIYVAGYLGPPPDSVQTRSRFVRGIVGLDQAMKELSTITLENLGYVGEWHSHPEYHESNLSADDREFLQRMKALTLLEDAPALMMIAGNNGIRCAVMNPENEQEESALL